MGKRKESVPEPDLNASTTSSQSSPGKRTKRNKRKRYNSDEYIMDDKEFMEVTIKTPTTPVTTPTVKPQPTPQPVLEHPEIHIKSELPLVLSEEKLQKKVKSPKSQGKKKGDVKKKQQKSKDSGTSSEEERWLDAIESGKLEEVDEELKKIKPKDPKLMTARQRAMYERTNEKDSPAYALMSLPTGYKEKVMTAEAIQKAQLKSQKRKQLADEKREKDKKKTMERLLKKQDSKSVKQIKNRPVKLQIPRISYKQTYDGVSISLPEGIPFPFEPQIAKEAPKPIVCAIPHCKNLKKYNCSKTNVPLCSFKCYKANIEMLKKIIC